ncbi:sorbitol dehydrogenase-like [Odontomachus brunneus]|uniref:sorbitol dehydrogenase-like n=1 Tax=Odontomachus brunneus TaxID=486640 RepID=UPI0013F24767|nr:sorbitol dehydrogenase-like [Odontomachus brunneus]
MEYLSFDLSSKSLTLKKSDNIPKPAPDEVRIKVAYSGICGTDLHILEGSFPCKEDGPVTLGHEFVGTIDELGSNVTIFKVGQCVAVDPNNGCNKCDHCHNANYHYCELGGINNTIGIYRNGGWATHALVPETQVYLIPDGVEMHQAVLSEPLSCLAHGWDKVNPVNVGSKVLVIGAGIIGLLWTCLLHLHGLRKTVTISEPQERRRQIADNLGLNYDIKSPSEMKGNFDVAVDCSGSGPAMEAAVSLLGPGGRLCVFGVASPQTKLTIEPFQIYKKELSILGVNINPYSFSKGLALLQAMSEKYINYNKLGIKIFSLSQHEDAIHALKKGEISKAVFKL